MMQQTTDYKIFKFRKDNRDKIMQGHVNSLVNSIKSRNMLSYRPILVNEQMEILDGQHRLLAAQQLGIPIFYEIKKDAKKEDIIYLNISKAWTDIDFFNFFVKNEYEEYKKLHYFMEEHKLPLKVALDLILGRSEERRKFRSGKFVFEKIAEKKEIISICNKTLALVKRVKGNITSANTWASTRRFWAAMFYFFQQDNFSEEKWLRNLEKYIEKFNTRPTKNDYLKLMTEVFNKHNLNPIKLELD